MSTNATWKPDRDYGRYLYSTNVRISRSGTAAVIKAVSVVGCVTRVTTATTKLCGTKSSLTAHIVA